MKRRLTLLSFAMLFSVGIIAQNPGDDPAFVDGTVNPIDVLSKCDQQLGTIIQPADNGRFLTSTRDFGWFGGALTYELAQQVHFPLLAPSGQMLEYVAIVSIAQDPNQNGDFSFWTDNGGQPGSMIVSEPLQAQDNLVYVLSDAVAASLTPYYGGELWISYSSEGDPTAIRGRRWGWGATESPTNQANGHPPYHLYYHDELGRFPDCPKWTNHTLCPSSAKSGPYFGLNYQLGFCRNARLNIGTGVPTMTQWGLFLFGLVVLTLATVSIYNYAKRRKYQNQLS